MGEQAIKEVNLAIVKSKREVRQRQLAKIKQFLADPTTQSTLTELYNQFFKTQIFKSARSIGVTLSMENEINTQPIIDRAMKAQKQVVVPRTLPHRQMEFVGLNQSTRFEKNKFGTTEPVNGDVWAKDKIDVLVVPGLAFTQDHYRIGFGGGYYDRFLADYPGLAVAIATPPQWLLTPDWPVEEFDIALDEVIHLGRTVG